MKYGKISPSRDISLAVEAVRNLESVLERASRKRKLTTEQRHEFLKCANYLKKKRQKAGEGNILLPSPFWVNVLRCLSWIVKNGKHISQIFAAIIGAN